MLVYEQQQGYTKLKKKSRHGARTLLRLHRALQFVIQFLTGLKENTGDNLSGVTWDAYKCTLGNYHPWIIRKTVGVAVYAVPTRQQLLEKMSSTHEEPEVDLMETLGKIIEAANVVYDNVEHLYAENNLLDLA
ncbi:unnamed protein product [Owenia fusiformis]|uniref:Glycolipid transfer protein domain-containing protein n=1 Tax=Owenia fusiformis TaxID=6347 RepID=A0A8S4N139_OWEFU|nr:unnamed protein product [Owenia fusiformis]